MALLNFTRFGIQKKDVFNDAYKYIIGFDLGDGEISASYLNLGTTIIIPVDLSFDSNDDRKIYSALFRKNNGTFFYGRGEDLKFNNNIGKLFMHFKVKPSRLQELYEGTNITKRELMQEMLRQGIKAIIDHNNTQDFSGKGILAIGCPSSPEWLANDMDIYYANILADGIKDCGLDLSIIIMPESRASLIKIYNERVKGDTMQNTKGGNFLERLHDGGVFVIDHGSSTLDCTSIDFDNNKQNDESVPLGASFIEKSMLNEFCKKVNCEKNDIIEIDNAMIDLRVAKETYFTNPDSKPIIAIECKNGDKVMRLNTEFIKSVINNNIVSYSTNINSAVSGSWNELHKKFIKNCKEHWQKKTNNKDDEFNGIILLTGGASKMGFVKDNAAKIFPNAAIENDTEPTYCVSRGLCYATRTDLKAYKLIKTVKDKIANAIVLTDLKHSLGDKLAPIVYDYLKKKVDYWVDKGENVSLNDMIENATKNFNIEHKKDIEPIIKYVLSSYLNKEGKDGIKAIIINIVNETFQNEFPGKLNEHAIKVFNISDEEWGRVVNIISNVDSIGINGSLVDNIDFESSVSRALKDNVFVALAVLPFYIIAKLWDYCFDAEYGDKIDKFLTNKRAQTCSKEDRLKVQEKLTNNKEKNTNAIKNSLIWSCISSENENKIKGFIIENLDPVINKAVDNVSLYF